MIALRRFALTECAPLFANLPTPVSDSAPRSMEKYNQGYGCILYRTTMPAGPRPRSKRRRSTISATYSWMGERIGVMDRRSGSYRVPAAGAGKAPQRWTFWSSRWGA